VSNCIYCHDPRFTDEAIAASRDETVEEWRAFVASLPKPPAEIQPGVLVTLRSDLKRPRRVFTIECVHDRGVWIEGYGAVSWQAVLEVVQHAQLDLFGGAA